MEQDFREALENYYQERLEQETTGNKNDEMIEELYEELSLFVRWDDDDYDW